MKMRFFWSWSVWSQSLSGAALNLSPLARLPLWIWHSHGFLSRKKDAHPIYQSGVPKLTPLPPSKEFLFDENIRILHEAQQYSSLLEVVCFHLT